MSQAHGFGLTQVAENSRLVLTVKNCVGDCKSASPCESGELSGFATLVLRVEAGAQLTLVEQFESTDIESSNLSHCVAW